MVVNRLVKNSLVLLVLLSVVVSGFNVVAEEKFPEIKDYNQTLLQTFYWEMGQGQYAEKYPEEINLWKLLARRAPELADLGFTALWIPPANKAWAGIEDVGYGAYDLWDLGEFRQKGTIRTKYGSKEELVRAIAALQSEGIKVFYDAVLNHRMGADYQEMVPQQSGQSIAAWTGFGLAGREKYYSRADKWKWDWQAFDGTDLTGTYLFKDKTWDQTFDHDFLMGNDVDYQNPLVKHELKEWGNWLVNQLGFDGFRIDAIKHIDTPFMAEWMDYLQEQSAKELTFIGEAWYNDLMGLKIYLDSVPGKELLLFDFSLRNSFALLRDGSLKLATLKKAGLVNRKGYGERVVTFVDNHDTGRDVTEYATPIFKRKLQAYTYILLREVGWPMVYWKDYYNSEQQEELAKIIRARKYFAYGPGYEVENNDDEIYSYVRGGFEHLPGTGLVMMISGGDSNLIRTKRINSRKANTVFYDFTGNIGSVVITDQNGFGQFKVINSPNKGWSIWVPLI